MALLQDRGINDMNTLNLWALVDIIKSFNDFNKDGSYNIGLSYTKLLDKAILVPKPPNNTCPATQEDLKQAVKDIKASLSSHLYSFPAINSQTYASAVRGPTESFLPLTTKPSAPTEVQEKEILISLKNANKSSIFATASVTTLTNKFNLGPVWLKQSWIIIWIDNENNTQC